MDWKIIDEKLVATYKTPCFETIIEKLNDLAVYAEMEEHHPDFKVYDYNKIRFELSTHEKKSVTAADYKMAEFIDDLFS